MNNTSNQKLDVICILFSEFHIEIGNQIVYQYPQNYIRKEDFQRISNLILPNQKACYTLSVLSMGGNYIVGYPVYLESIVYNRNSYFFNFSIVLSKEVYSKNYQVYDSLVDKINKLLAQTEIEEKFDFIQKNTELIKTFINELYAIIKKGSEISIEIGYKNDKKFIFDFNVLDYQSKEIEIKSEHVPFWIKSISKDTITKNEKEFITIIHSIDGINTVNTIAEKNNIPIQIVEQVIANLHNQNMITLNEKIEFSNSFRARSELRRFDKKDLYEKYKKFCEMNTQYSKENYEQIQKLTNNEMSNAMIVNDTIVFNLLCQLTNSKNIKEFVQKYELRGVNVFYLVQIGLYFNLIIKVNSKK